ncbi:MAG TPA: selenocysteine-specific translation elongation factor [Myxococcales bacterium]|nr:selenocysteine-specific translation elongation factor [Myxococcales bacterium]
MRRFVIGTAGHVDHGKTALVKALTGIDTDRLPEEKRRGITTELGFAHLDLPEGPAGVVDVPGHERFVRAMVAGAGGMDVALLVVASDEGVMPQTREHVDICGLLGMRTGVVAITKGDLLPGLGEEWHRLLHADVHELIAGTFLEGAAVLEVSAKTGAGLPALVEALAAVAAKVPPRPVVGPAFLPLDRAFTLKGFGTIATGTLLSGSLEVDQAVDLLPDGPTGVRVRGLQVFGRNVGRVEAGQRTAVNLTGVEVGQLRRGMAVCREGELVATPMLDVALSNPVSGLRPLPATSKLLCHIGTDVVSCSAVLLGREALAPGESGFAQLRLSRPVAAHSGQHLILRGFGGTRGRGQTVGGGTVVAILPRRRRPGRPSATAGLDVLAGPDALAKIDWLLEDAGPGGLTERDLLRRTALPASEISQVVATLGSRGRAVLADRERRLFVGGTVFEGLLARAADLVLAHHRDNPLAPGIPREELRRRLASGLDVQVFAKVLAGLAAGGRLAVEGDTVRFLSHAQEVRETDSDMRRRLVETLAAGGLSPPGPAELAAGCGATPERVLALLKLLQAEGQAIRVKDDLYFAAVAIEELGARLRAHLVAKGEITTPEFKEMTGATRKFTIPLGEYFDREKLTIRLGDKRVLRAPSGAATRESSSRPSDPKLGAGR